MSENKQTSRKRPSFFAELRRRKVFRVAITYSIVGWLVIQVAVSTFPNLTIPDWGTRLVIMCVILGFPIALIITWAFEITPDGIKRTTTARKVRRSAESADSHNRKRNIIAFSFGAAVPSLIFGALFLYFYTGSPRSEPKWSLEKSIAVLPFENRSNNPDDVFFTDGVQDDLLTQISYIGGIKTISRTSVMQYRENRPNLRTIGEELGVATILEGGVQRAGNQVRINVQLIDAATDAHIWAQTYDRELTARNILDIQSEIAGAIARELRGVLSPRGHRGLHTGNLAAMEAYYRGRTGYNLGTIDDLHVAIEHFSRAIELDPTFAEAYAGIALSHIRLIWSAGLSPEEQVAKAEPFIERALELGPDSSEAYTALGYLRQYQDGDTDITRSVEAYERAIELNPNDADTYMYYSRRLRGGGRIRDAVRMAKKAVELDPLNLEAKESLASILGDDGQDEEAIQLCLEIIRKDPKRSSTYFTMGSLLGYENRFDEAIKALRTAYSLDPQHVGSARSLGQFYEDIGMPNEGLFWWKRALAQAPEGRQADLCRMVIADIQGNTQVREEVAFRILREQRDSWMANSAFFNLWDLYMSQGRFNEARELAIEKDPELLNPDVVFDEGNFHYGFSYAIALLKIGKTELAAPYVEKIVAILPNIQRRGAVHSIGNFDMSLYMALGEHAKAAQVAKEWREAGGLDDFSRYWDYDELREVPEIIEIQNEMIAELAEQRANVERWEANGELAPIPPLPGEAK